jgi:sugar phosphate isomerase/epimerase
MGIHGASLEAFPIPEIVEILGELELHWLEVHAAQIRLGEIAEGPDAGPPATPQEIRELRRLLESSDITPTSYTTIQLTADHETNRAIFGRAESLGVRNLTGIPRPGTLDELEALADEFGVRLAIHNNAAGSFTQIDEVVAAMSGRGPNVGACLDIGHAIRRSEDPADAVRRLGSRLIGIHLKDVSSRDLDSNVIVPGRGFLDVPAFFAAVLEVGFPDDGALSLEYLENPNDPLPGIREGLRVTSAALDL